MTLLIIPHHVNLLNTGAYRECGYLGLPHTAPAASTDLNPLLLEIKADTNTLRHRTLHLKNIIFFHIVLVSRALL